MRGVEGRVVEEVDVLAEEEVTVLGYLGEGVMILGGVWGRNDGNSGRVNFRGRVWRIYIFNGMVLVARGSGAWSKGIVTISFIFVCWIWTRAEKPWVGRGEGSRGWNAARWKTLDVDTVRGPFLCRVACHFCVQDGGYHGSRLSRALELLFFFLQQARGRAGVEKMASRK